MSSAKTLDGFAEEFPPSRIVPAGLRTFNDTIRNAVSYFDTRSVFEIGAGRAPNFSLDEVKAKNLHYTINDIVQSELDRAPDGYDGKICADLSKEAPDVETDFIFSRMVYEHVRDNRSSLLNQMKMLTAGGVAMHLHPVMYSSPFIINAILPEESSDRLLRTFFPHRNDDGTPKFPAHYDWCRATGAQEQKLRDLGFSEAKLIPIYGHSYYRKIPLAQPLVNAAARLANKLDARLWASYCLTMVRK